MDNLPTIATKNVDVPLTMVIFLSIQHGDCPLTMLFFRDFPWLFRSTGSDQRIDLQETRALTPTLR